MSLACHNPLVPEGFYISKVEGCIITISPIQTKTYDDFEWERIWATIREELSENREYLPLTNPEE